MQRMHVKIFTPCKSIIGGVLGVLLSGVSTLNLGILKCKECNVCRILVHNRYWQVAQKLCVVGIDA